MNVGRWRMDTRDNQGWGRYQMCPNLSMRFNCKRWVAKNLNGRASNSPYVFSTRTNSCCSSKTLPPNKCSLHCSDQKSSPEFTPAQSLPLHLRLSMRSFCHFFSHSVGTQATGVLTGSGAPRHCGQACRRRPRRSHSIPCSAKLSSCCCASVLPTALLQRKPTSAPPCVSHNS